MKKELQNKELQEYLKRFADNAAVSMIVADIKKQKKYDGKFAVITDMDQPVFVYAIDSEEPFSEEEKIAQAKDETPEVIYEDDTDITYKCANCGQEYTQEKDYKSNYCGNCGQRFIWKEDKEEAR